MNVLLVFETIRQLAKFGGSFRKEAIGAGTVVPAVLSILNTYHNAGSWSTVSVDQWTFLVGSVVALLVHLNAKRKDAEE